VAPNQGALLMLLAQSVGAQRILELGTLGGYSTIWLARALRPHGRVITVEMDEKHAQVARENMAAAGLSMQVDVRHGRCRDVLDELVREDVPRFDLTFIDADKQSAPEYFRKALELSRQGSLIIVDNVVRDGDVADANSVDARTQGVRECLAMMGREPRVQATAIQTVGSKGYDGFAVARVIVA
jgi:predicted O-methyltransferase YrrM